ncbi:hypothetical protein PBY51_020577 [Eleginops maclovinus]|uniref:Uncharacterized protein n=1 Tax=Eleginops maclovinus TaxID=56733 RepID=A0AAN8AKT5_ELEMC|nr:hypothetical protein PBY51_020577 [Eleginops maclovinus]
MSNRYCPMPFPLPANAFADSLRRNLSAIKSNSQMLKLLEKNQQPAVLISTCFGDLPERSVLSYHTNLSSKAGNDSLFLLPSQPCSFKTVLDDIEAGYYGGLAVTYITIRDRDQGTEPQQDPA